MAKKVKTEGVLARELRLEAEREAAAAQAAASQAAAEEAARLIEEKRAAKAEKRKKLKRPRFVREVVAKKVTVPTKPKPEFARSTSARGRMMTKNVVLAPKEDAALTRSVML